MAKLCRSIYGSVQSRAQSVQTYGNVGLHPRRAQQIVQWPIGEEQCGNELLELVGLRQRSGAQSGLWPSGANGIGVGQTGVQQSGEGIGDEGSIFGIGARDAMQNVSAYNDELLELVGLQQRSAEQSGLWPSREAQSNVGSIGAGASDKLLHPTGLQPSDARQSGTLPSAQFPTGQWSNGPWPNSLRSTGQLPSVVDETDFGQNIPISYNILPHDASVPSGAVQRDTELSGSGFRQGEQLPYNMNPYYSSVEPSFIVRSAAEQSGSHPISTQANYVEQFEPTLRDVHQYYSSAQSNFVVAGAAAQNSSVPVETGEDSLQIGEKHRSIAQFGAGLSSTGRSDEEASGSRISKMDVEFLENLNDIQFWELLRRTHRKMKDYWSNFCFSKWMLTRTDGRKMFCTSKFKSADLFKNATLYYALCETKSGTVIKCKADFLICDCYYADEGSDRFWIAYSSDLNKYFYFEAESFEDNELTITFTFPGIYEP